MIKIGAINSAKTAIINVGTSPIPIGFPKLGLSENKFNSLGYPWVIMDNEKTILVIKRVMFVFIINQNLKNAIYNKM
jgi:hypothetical protein